jgi:hypothetical protein
MRVGAALLAACLVAGTAGGARAEEGSFAKDFGLGMGAFGVNLLYMPAKFVYASLGAVTGGFAYVLTGANMEVGQRIWKPSMGGTYVVTPSMLAGEDRIMFSGENEPRGTSAYTREEEDVGTAEPVDRGEPYQGF